MSDNIARQLSDENAAKIKQMFGELITGNKIDSTILNARGNSIHLPAN